jgi:hypothetical protein
MANNTFTYVGVYDSIAAAEADFEAVKALRQDDLTHVYDMAVVGLFLGRVRASYP